MQPQFSPESYHCAPGSGCVVEPLEGRCLFSTWSTIEDFQMEPGGHSGYLAMTADAAGNLYAVGRAFDANGVAHSILREKPAGGDTWTTTWHVAPQAFSGIADIEVGAGGDVYVAGSFSGAGWVVARRAAGASEFSTVDQSAGSIADMTIDADGNVFAVGRTAVTTTVKGKQTSTSVWTVRKQNAGASAFATVDSFLYAGADAAALGVTNIADGSAAGTYVVGFGGNGSTPYRHLVRKSTNGGQTWSLVDDFQYQAGQWSVGSVVSGDGEGNVYVAGKASTKTGSGKNVVTTTHWTVRKSLSGTAGSWSLDNAAAMGASWGSDPTAIGADGNGHMYVVGGRMPSTSGAVSIVRSNAGGSWETVDEFQLAPGKEARLTDFARDAAGNIFVGGYAYGDTGIAHAVVRSSSVTSQGAMTATLCSTFSTTSIAFESDSSDADTLAEELAVAAV